jgi:hypothetical protein
VLEGVLEEPLNARVVVDDEDLSCHTFSRHGYPVSPGGWAGLPAGCGCSIRASRVESARVERR